MITVHPQETHGRVTPEQWRAGLRYAEILWDRFCREKPSWVDRDELRSAAYEGLMRAARRYEPRRGAWSTLMHPAIKQSLERAWIAQQNAVQLRPPTSRFWEAEGYDPNEALTPISLDQLTGPDGVPLGDFREAPDNTEVESLARVERERWQDRIARIFEHLTPREREVLRSRAEGRTLLELARQLSCSRERIRQIERKATDKARRVAEELGIRP